MLTTARAKNALTSGSYIVSHAEQCGADVDSTSSYVGEGWVAASV